MDAGKKRDVKQVIIYYCGQKNRFTVFMLGFVSFVESCSMRKNRVHSFSAFGAYVQ